MRHVLRVPAETSLSRRRGLRGMLGMLLVLLAGLHMSAVSSPARNMADGMKLLYVSIQENAPVYPTLEAARADAPTAVRLSPPPQDDAFRVLERREGWARIHQPHGDGENTEGWIGVDALLPLDDYLRDPAYRGSVFCPAESADYTEALNPATLAAGVIVDLDPERRKAVLTMRLIPTLRGGGGVLEVRAADGALLWSSPALGPTMMDLPPEDAFYCSPFGFRWPQQAGDMDGDGRAELLIHHPQTEMGPGAYTLLRWTGTAFEPVFRDRQLVQPGNPETPVWTLRPVGDEGAELPPSVSWVDGWPALRSDGTLIGHVEHNAPEAGDGAQWSAGTARFRLYPDKGEAVFLGWVTPLSSDEEEVREK